MINKVTLIGNLGADPEVRQSSSGMSIANLRVATNERIKKGDEWQDHTEWHRVVCFGRTAENVGKYLSKGRSIYVEGKLRTNKWQDKEGKDRYTTEIIADNIKFLGGGEHGGGGGGSRVPAHPGNGGGNEPDDIMPF